MEISYGIGVKNRYSLFMCDEVIDPLEIISKPQKENIKSTASSNVNTANSNKTKVSNKKTRPATNNVETKLTKAKIVNGSSNVHITASQNKSSTGPSQKVTSGSGKAQAKDSLSHSTSLNTPSVRKGADKPDRNNRLVPQEKKALNNVGNSVNLSTNALQESSKNQGEFLNNVPRHQRDIEERKDRKNREDRQKNVRITNFSEFRERGDEMRSSRGRGGRGGFRPRGRGRGGSFDNRGKREYDRHSGSDKSGVKPVEKREGSGSYNWGNPTDDLVAVVNATLEENHEHDENALNNSTKGNSVDDWAGAYSDKANVDNGVREMTLDEWRKQEQEKRIFPNHNLRKGGEGADTSHWTKGYVLKRKDEGTEEKEYEEVETEEETKHGRQKRILDIEIKFKDENRDLRNRRGRGRGGRGSGRGGRGGERDVEESKNTRRGGSFQEPKEQMAPKVDDWNDFPSLST